NVCSHCMKLFSPSQRKKKRISSCTKCNQVFFCSKVCIDENASALETRHYDSECRALKTMYSPKWQDVDMGMFRLLMKVLSRRKYEKENRVASNEDAENGEDIETSFDYVDNLVSHYHKPHEGGEQRPISKEEDVNERFVDALLRNLAPDLIAGLDREALL